MIIVTDYCKHEAGLENYIADHSKDKENFMLYRKRWQDNKDSLLFILLETTSKCNLRCKMCAHSVGYKKVVDMDDYLFGIILENIKSMNIPSVCMNCTNEPLLDKNIINRIKKIYSLNCVYDIMMNTNAVLLDEFMSERIIDSGLTRLLIGFDAFTQEVYENIRQGATYAKVFQNILTLLDIKEKKGAYLPVVRISLVRTKLNEAEIGAWVNFWRDKADYLTIQEYLTPVADHSKDYLRGDTSIRKKLNYSDITCKQPFERVAIRGDGSVLPCCSHLAVDMPIGNLYEQSLKEIWHGENMEALRDLFRRHQWAEHPICSKCLKISFELS
jgi:radical SAM protein with 4Fe4S-binding SPASM domain